jgi:hypothetical protein
MELEDVMASLADALDEVAPEAIPTTKEILQKWSICVQADGLLSYIQHRLESVGSVAGSLEGLTTAGDKAE